MGAGIGAPRAALRNLGIPIKSIDYVEIEANTITCRQDRSPAQIVEIADRLYRFLTEQECWRLMGFTDQEYEAAMSVNPTKGKMNRTLYEQAGNSMPVPVLESLFEALGFANETMGFAK